MKEGDGRATHHDQEGSRNKGNDFPKNTGRKEKKKKKKKKTNKHGTRTTSTNENFQMNKKKKSLFTEEFLPRMVHKATEFSKKKIVMCTEGT